MKNIIFIIIILWVSPILIGQNMSVMTYNIRYDNPEDSANSWSNRKALLSSQINFYHPDVVGVQEALDHQLSFLDSALNDYSYIGVGRKDGKNKGEYNDIFYDYNKFDLQ